MFSFLDVKYHFYSAVGNLYLFNSTSTGTLDEFLSASGSLGSAAVTNNIYLFTASIAPQSGQVHFVYSNASQVLNDNLLTASVVAPTREVLVMFIAFMAALPFVTMGQAETRAFA